VTWFELGIIIGEESCPRPGLEKGLGKQVGQVKEAGVEA